MMARSIREWHIKYIRYMSSSDAVLGSAEMRNWEAAQIEVRVRVAHSGHIGRTAMHGADTVLRGCRFEDTEP
jgi:hypothetical protein